MNPIEKKWHSYLEKRGYYNISIDFYPKHLRQPLIKYSFEWDTFSDYVNNQLRKGIVSPDVKIIDEAFKQPIAKLLHDETLYRIIANNFGFDYKVGDIFTDKAYVSTSINPENFNSKLGNNNTLCFEIKAKQNSPAIVISTRNVNNSEFEILLPRDSKFKITDIKDNLIYMHTI